jgi:hypothetical protein
VLRNAQGHTLLLPPPRLARKSGEASDVPTLVSKMWHFPTVAVAKEPLPELRAFLGKLFSTGANRGLHFEPLERVRHAVTYRAVSVVAFQIAVESLPKIPGARILGLDDFSSLPVSNLTRKIARAALSLTAAAIASD